MRLFGVHFLGQGVTFVYLTQAAQIPPHLSVALWPQFSIYNFVVSNFWPLYWIGYVLDRAKVQETYQHIFMLAHHRVGDVIGVAHSVIR